jgi:Ca-activated chloride channel homolog
MTVWAATWAFAFLIPLIAVFVYRYWRRRQLLPTLQVSSVSLFKKLPKGLRAKFSFLPQLLTFTALTLIVIALARPQLADTKVKKSVEGIDLLLVLDISDSMLIEDMPPHLNRLEASKKIMSDFVKSRLSDRLGYVVFAGEAFTRVPPTLDYKLLLESISSTKISRNIKMGTAIGNALALAAARLKDSTARSKVIVFMTDGENNSGTIDPETALEIAKGYGIKIYSIGAGVDGDAQLPIETEDAFGRKVKRYQPIHSSVNDDLLGKFASQTGGKYYRATTSGGLQKVFQDIARLEKTKIETSQFTKYSEKFEPWLLAGVLLFMLAKLLELTLFRRGP